MHTDTTALPAEGLRPNADRLQLPVDQNRGQSRLTREATVRLGSHLIPQLLETSHTGVPVLLPAERHLN